MDNKELKNRGITAPFIAVACLIAAVFIGAFFVDGNAISRAPVLNKAIAAVLGIAAVWWTVLVAKDVITLSKNRHINLGLQLLILAALVIIALFTLMTWHSGALGTQTNPL